jgi:hypothetical protein
LGHERASHEVLPKDETGGILVEIAMETENIPAGAYAPDIHSYWILAAEDTLIGHGLPTDYGILNSNPDRRNTLAHMDRIVQTPGIREKWN